ncbi:hypothetical protein SUGI_1024300 [Cryptomeria japonica]|nr:hypothetical protein SUGI_1024300 [Cryptomeria japonica]
MSLSLSGLNRALFEKAKELSILLHINYSNKKNDKPELDIRVKQNGKLLRILSKPLLSLNKVTCLAARFFCFLQLYSFIAHLRSQKLNLKIEITQKFAQHKQTLDKIQRSIMA